MQVDAENKPLVGSNGGGSSSDDSVLTRTKERCWKCKYQMLFLVLVVIGTLLVFPPGGGKASKAAASSSSAFVENPPPPLAAEEIQMTTAMYRPFCLIHGSGSNSQGPTTARILQTSMGNPSQQWSHIPCYAQPEKVRRWINKPKASVDDLNMYGAPDAIIQTKLSEKAFPDRTPILGFGAAFTEASSLNYQSLSEAGKQKLMELLFGKSGLGYSLGRVHINSCDFSIQSYSFDDTEDDFKLKDFDMDVTHDAQPDGMIDMIKRATTVFNEEWKSLDGVDGNFKMYASPWSPPAWMKAPHSGDHIDLATHAEGMLGSAEPSCLREGTGAASRYAKSWALYFSKFITACKFWFCSL